MLRMTVQEYNALVRGQKLPPDEKAGVKKPNKHRNVKVYVYEDGFSSTEKIEGHGRIIEHFDSIKEHRRSKELRLMERAGKISNLQLQTPMVISPAFVDKDGKKHRAIVYRADFTYLEDGQEIVEDVKGFDKKSQKFLCTEAFRLKWKMLQNLYPEKTFRLY